MHSQKINITVTTGDGVGRSYTLRPNHDLGTQLAVIDQFGAWLWYRADDEFNSLVNCLLKDCVKGLVDSGAMEASKRVTVRNPLADTREANYTAATGSLNPADYAIAA